MPGVPITDLADLLNSTRSHYPLPDFNQTLKYSDYPVLNRIMKRRRTWPGGTSIKVVLNINENGSARFTELYEPLSANQVDTSITLEQGWTFGDANYLIDNRELDLNGGRRGAEQLASLRKLKQSAGLESVANLIESAAWDVPYDASDTKRPNGFPWHIAMGPSGAYTAGFVGQTARYGDNTTTTTTISGANRSTAGNERLKNWTGTYTAVNAAFFKSLRKAALDTRFRPPVTMMTGEQARSGDFAYYCNQEVALQIEEFLDARGDNTGIRDLRSVDGFPIYVNAPFVYVPALDKTSTTDTHVVRRYEPVYGINTRHMIPYTLSGNWITEDKSHMWHLNHHVAITPLSWMLQFMNMNPKYGGFVLHKQI